VTQPANFLAFQAVLRRTQLRRYHANGRPDLGVARRYCAAGSPARGWQKAGSAGDSCSHTPPRLARGHRAPPRSRAAGAAISRTCGTPSAIILIKKLRPIRRDHQRHGTPMRQEALPIVWAGPPELGFQWGERWVEPRGFETPDLLVANQCQVGLWRSLEQVGGLRQSCAAAPSRWRCRIRVLYGFSPATRRACLGTICGSNFPFRSRRTSSGIWPTSVTTVGEQRLRRLPDGNGGRSPFGGQTRQRVQREAGSGTRKD
jgi:hypothetical protein